MIRSQLDRLQRELLAAFFRRESRFFLTGGAALAGYHLGHRPTHDLDLFTTLDALEDGERALAGIAREMGASLESIRTAPDYRRQLLRQGPDAVVIDLVRVHAAQLIPDKPVIAGVRVDPPDEILANKLCALLGRAELRDLVDVWALERAGFDVERALPGGARKDGGLTPAQLAWVLSQITIGDDAAPPAGVSVGQLRQYLAELVAKLSRLAFPHPAPPQDRPG